MCVCVLDVSVCPHAVEPILPVVLLKYIVLASSTATETRLVLDGVYRPALSLGGVNRVVVVWISTISERIQSRSD